MKEFVKIFIFILISEAAGIIGSIFTVSQIPTWYADLNKPFFNPPNFLFGPVWTTLYALMGISAYLIWEKGIKNIAVRKAITLFVIQLFLNTLWSIIFFGLQNPGLAFIEIVILWIFILKTIINFNQISKPAAYLLIPYLAWVTFAGILNFSIYLLN